MSHKKLKTVEGKWDCEYCGTTHIPGLTKVCPNCGNPVSEGQKYYLSGDPMSLPAIRESDGAEWVCRYCGTYNHHDAKTCVNCGGDLAGAEDYFSQGKKYKEIPVERNTTVSREHTTAKAVNLEAKNENKEIPLVLKKAPIWLKVAAVWMILVSIIGTIFMPHTVSATVVEKSWHREQEVEVYKTVEDGGWYLPEGAHDEYQTWEINHYNHVLKGYETVPVQKSRQVYDGEACSIYTTSNGDGSFDVHESCHSTYRTEWYTDYEQRAVYEDVPVYDWYYHYQIERWVPEETLTAEGKTNSIYWPTKELSENERYGATKERYTVVVEAKGREHSSKVSEQQYLDAVVGNDVKIKMNSLGIVSAYGIEEQE